MNEHEFELTEEGKEKFNLLLPNVRRKEMKF